MDEYHGQMDEEEAEDTLSLRDLPLHSNTTKIPEWVNSKQFKENNECSYHSFSDQEEEEEENFEFSSPEWGGSSYSSSSTQSSQNVIFFGKLIPIRQPTSNTNNLYSNNKKHNKSTKRAQMEKLEIGSGSVSPGSNLKRKNNMFKFGLMAARSVPREMVLSDIKNRQSRRQSLGILWPSDCSGSKKKGFWRSLMFLSCARPNKSIYDYDLD